MKIYSGASDFVKIEVWKYGEGEFRPLQTYARIEEFHVSINGEKIIVYYNKSKSGVDYYYLKFNGLWHWTRDNIRNQAQNTT